MIFNIYAAERVYSYSTGPLNDHAFYRLKSDRRYMDVRNTAMPPSCLLDGPTANPTAPPPESREHRVDGNARGDSFTLIRRRVGSENVTAVALYDIAFQLLCQRCHTHECQACTTVPLNEKNDNHQQQRNSSITKTAATTKQQQQQQQQHQNSSSSNTKAAAAAAADQ